MNVINEIFAEYHKKRKKLEISVEEMKRELAPYINKILIYGAGSSGIAFLYDLRKIGIEPLYFVDSDEKKINTECEGLKIIAPGDIFSKTGEDFLIIVCINTDGKRYCKSFEEALRIGGDRKSVV